MHRPSPAWFAKTVGDICTRKEKIPTIAPAVTTSRTGRKEHLMTKFDTHYRQHVTAYHIALVEDTYGTYGITFVGRHDPHFLAFERSLGALLPNVKGDFTSAEKTLILKHALRIVARLEE